MAVFDYFERLMVRPAPFSVYTAVDLWADPHISRQMLVHHLDPSGSLASRTAVFIERSVEWLRATSGIEPDTRVVDLGCGPGLYANPLAAAGTHVTGIDVSAHSLEHARSSAPRGTPPDYILGNYLEVEMAGEFDVAIMVMCDYSALSAMQRRTILGRIRSWLAPGGRFVFDVHGLGSLRAREEDVVYAPNLMDGFWAPPPYHGFLHRFVYEDERVTLDKYEIVEAHRSRTIYNWLQHFDPASISQELEAEGFRVDRLVGDLAGAPFEAESAEFGVVAARDS